MTTGEEIPAAEIQTGYLLQDRTLAGTHGQRVEVQWVGHHNLRKRTYVAGVEELSRHPVQLAYDDAKKIQVWRS